MTTMDTDRKSFLRRSLASRLESVAPQDADRMARAEWLGEQVHNYVERWLGFQAACSGPMPPAQDDDLFGMIEVGAELMGEELAAAAVTTGTQANWRQFLAAMDGVRCEAGEWQERLKEALAGVRDAIANRSR
jgi:hypothetical protein